MSRTTWTLAVLLIGLASSPAAARIIYVNNRTGDDINDGSTTDVGFLRTGPVRTLTRAAVLIGPGDEIQIANTGDPYYGSLHLVGHNASGTADHPTIVYGNGAILDGSEPVAPDAWQPLGHGLWRLEPREKGWFQLVRDSATVTETMHPPAAGQPSPAAGTWSAWHGSIYYQALPDELPFLEPFRIATKEAGVFAYGVHDLVVRDLTVRHFRLDGVNVHDQAWRFLLQNVVSEKNGRSGVFVGGSSRIIMSGGATSGNREASLLIQEQAKADVREAKLDTQPVVHP